MCENTDFPCFDDRNPPIDTLPFILNFRWSKGHGSGGQGIRRIKGRGHGVMGVMGVMGVRRSQCQQGVRGQEVKVSLSRG